MRLVSPETFDPWRIEGIAHNSAAFVAGIEIVDTLEAAIADCVHVAVLTARGRTAKRRTLRPREAAAELLERSVDGPVAMAEIHLDAIPARKGPAGFARAHYAPPALQAVKRDYAFLVPIETPAGDLLRTVQGADKTNIVAARVFDDFRGAGVPEGQKSLALEVTLQPLEKSYKDEDLKAITDKVTAAAAKLGAVLRG